jgi:hypothetical protein
MYIAISFMPSSQRSFFPNSKSVSYKVGFFPADSCIISRLYSPSPHPLTLSFFRVLLNSRNSTKALAPSRPKVLSFKLSSIILKNLASYRIELVDIGRSDLGLALTVSLKSRITSSFIYGTNVTAKCLTEERPQVLVWNFNESTSVKSTSSQ